MIRLRAFALLVLGVAMFSSASIAHAQGFHSIFTQDGVDVWVVGDGGLIYRSTNSGQDYFSYTVGTGALRGVAANGLTALLVSDAGKVSRSTNGGGAWSTQTLAGSPDLKGVAMPTGSVAYMVGVGGKILKSTDGGASWALQTSGTAQTLWAVRFLDAANGWAIGDAGTVRRTTDGGASWNPVAVGTLNRLRAIDQSGATIWITGDKGTCTHSIDDGANWSPVNLKLDARSDVRGLQVVGPNDIWIGSGGGAVRHSTDGGVTWTFMQHKMHGQLSSLVVNGAKAWFASYKNRIVFRTQNGGTSWTMPTAGSMSQTLAQKYALLSGTVRGNSIVLSPTDEARILCALGPTLFESKDEGETWQTLSSMPSGTQKVNAFVVSPKNPNYMCAAVGGTISDRVSRTTDGGATWTATLIKDFGEYGIPLEMHPDKPDTLFFGGDSDTLMRSTDFGATWHTYMTSPAFRSPCDIVVVPDSSNIILVGDGITGSGQAQYFKSSDSGLTFSLMSTRTGSEIPGMACARLRNSATMGTNWSSGGVQRTLDYGATWPVVNTAGSAWGCDIAKDDPYLQVFGQYSGAATYLSYDGGATWTSLVVSGIGSNYSFLARDRELVIAEQGGGLWKLQTTYSYTPSTATSLNLSVPNGGETWTAGTSHNIVWTHLNVPVVRLEYRRSAADPWQLIADVPGHLGSYAWTVPADPTYEAMVRVSDAWDAAPTDNSDGVFTIIAPIIQASPSPLYFGTLAKGSEATLELTIDNPGNATLDITNVVSTSDGFAPGRTSLSIPGGSSDTVGVTFRPGGGVGYAGSLDITSNGAGSPVLSIPISGIGLGSMYAASPEDIDLGEINPGATASDTVHIENAGTLPLNIASITSSHPDFYSNVTSLVIVPGGFDAVRLYYHPLKAGPDTTTFTLEADDSTLAHTVTVRGEARANVAVTDPAPAAFALAQNRPNPFARATSIRFGLPKAGEVTLEVFNLQGRRVATLVRGWQEAGWHSVPFDAAGLRKSGMTSGVYYYRFKAGTFEATRKMLFVR